MKTSIIVSLALLLSGITASPIPDPLNNVESSRILASRQVVVDGDWDEERDRDEDRPSYNPPAARSSFALHSRQIQVEVGGQPDDQQGEIIFG